MFLLSFVPAVKKLNNIEQDRMTTGREEQDSKVVI